VANRSRAAHSRSRGFATHTNAAIAAARLIAGRFEGPQSSNMAPLASMSMTLYLSPPTPQRAVVRLTVRRRQSPLGAAVRSGFRASGDEQVATYPDRSSPPRFRSTGSASGAGISISPDADSDRVLMEALLCISAFIATPEGKRRLLRQETTLRAYPEGAAHILGYENARLLS